jgi:hypothetical protein
MPGTSSKSLPKLIFGPKVTDSSLDQANEALAAVKGDAIDGAVVIVP